MGREQEATQQKHWDEWGLTPARVRHRTLAVEAERDRLREALEEIMAPAAANIHCDLRALARSALSPESNPEGQ